MADKKIYKFVENKPARCLRAGDHFCFTKEYGKYWEKYQTHVVSEAFRGNGELSSSSRFFTLRYYNGGGGTLQTAILPYDDSPTVYVVHVHDETELVE